MFKEIIRQSLGNRKIIYPLLNSNAKILVCTSAIKETGL